MQIQFLYSTRCKVFTLHKSSHCQRKILERFTFLSSIDLINSMEFLIRILRFGSVNNIANNKNWADKKAWFYPY